MAVVKQGNTTLNAGSKGDKGDTGAGGGDSNVNVISVTNLSELQSVTANKIASIQGDIDLGTTTVNIPSGVVLKFEGGSIINGTLNGDNTYIWAEEPLQVFDLTTDFTGTFHFKVCYPEWFGASQDLPDNRLYFNKATTFVDFCGGGIIELTNDYQFYAHKDGSAWGIGYDKLGKEGIIEVYDNTHIFSKNNSKIEITGNEPSTYNIYPIDGVNEGTRTIHLDYSDRVANPRQKVPRIDDEVSIDGVVLGIIESKISDNEWVLDAFAFVPNIGDWVSITVYEGDFRIFKMFASKNSSIKGLNIVGNREFLISEGVDPNLGTPTGIVFYGNCDNVIIDGNDISDIPADALNAAYQGNYEGETAGIYEGGGINITTGLDEVDVDKIRSWNTYSLDRTAIIENDRFMIADQGSYQQINAVPFGILDVFYYKADDTYLGCRLSQSMYEYLPIVKEAITGNPATYIRVVFTATDTSRFDYVATGGETEISIGKVRGNVTSTIMDYVWINEILQDEGTDYTWTEVTDVESIINFTTPLTASDVIWQSTDIYRVEPKAIEVPTNIQIINNTMHDLGRQGISGTGFQDITISNNVCYNVYGSPGAFIDFEDGEWLNRRITISYNTVWNCTLGIHLYSVSMVNITGNKFKRANDDVRGDTNSLTAQLSVNHVGGDLDVSNNYFEYGVVLITRGMLFSNNILVACSVQVSGGKVVNNAFNGSSLKIDASIEDKWKGTMVIDNNVFNARHGKGGFTMDSISTFQTPSYFTNNIFKGEYISNPAQFKSGLIVNNIVFENTISQPLVNSATVNGLKSNQWVSITYVPQDNEHVVYKDWEIKGSTAYVRTRGATTNLHHFTFENLTIETDVVANGLGAIDVDNNLGSLVLKNSSIIDRGTTNTNWSVINFDNTVDKFRMFNTEVVTATAGNLLDKGTSTEDATWIYKDCVFDTVILNNTLGIEVSNIINDVYTP